MDKELVVGVENATNIHAIMNSNTDIIYGLKHFYDALIRLYNDTKNINLEVAQIDGRLEEYSKKQLAIAAGLALLEKSLIENVKEIETGMDKIEARLK